MLRPFFVPFFVSLPPGKRCDLGVMHLKYFERLAIQNRDRDFDSQSQGRVRRHRSHLPRLLSDDSAGDPSHYHIEVNGEAVAVESVSVGAGRVVTLGLPEGVLINGDAIVVKWNGLSDGKRTYQGQTRTLSAR